MDNRTALRFELARTREQLHHVKRRDLEHAPRERQNFISHRGGPAYQSPQRTQSSQRKQLRSCSVASRQYRTGTLAEADAPSAALFAMAAQQHRVTVLEESTDLAVR